jgi:Tol biopolymer transport system component
VTFAASDQTSPAIGHDGKWVYFAEGAAAWSLFKVPAVGGEAIRVFEGHTDWLRVSPKGDLMAFWNVNRQASPPEAIGIMALESGRIVKRLNLTIPNTRWSPDGRALLYPKNQGDVSAIWMQPIDGTPPRQITIFQTDRIFDFDLSADGKQFVLARGRQVGDIVMITDMPTDEN